MELSLFKKLTICAIGAVLILMGLFLSLKTRYRDSEENCAATSVAATTQKTTTENINTTSICLSTATCAPTTVAIKTSSVTTTTVQSTTTTTHPTTDTTRQTTTQTEPPKPTYTEDDLFCLAAAIYQEAGSYNFSREARMMVGNVVLNRVNSPYYPNTIRKVLEQPYQWGLLSATGVVFPADAEFEYSKAAVAEAYECARLLLEGERVCPSNVLFSAEFKQGDGVYKTIDGIHFCYIN